MWSAGAIVKRSTRPFVRATPAAASTSLAFGRINSRDFSSDDNGNKDGGNNRPPMERRGGGGGRGGRGHNSYGRNSNSGYQGRGGGGGGGVDRRSNQPKPPNFAEKFIKPATEGELKNHRTTVPKLLGKKPKGHAVRGADVPSPKDDEEEFTLAMETDIVKDITMTPPSSSSSTLGDESSSTARTGTIAKNSPMDLLSADEKAKIDEFLADYQMLIHSDEPEKYYWDEREYDHEEDVKRAEILERLRAEATRDADGNLSVQVDDETFAMFRGLSSSSTNDSDEAPKDDGQTKRRSREAGSSPADDPVFEFVTEAMGIEGMDKPPPADYDRVLPLKLSGPTIYDFVESMMNHPSKFGEIYWEAPNVERDREPLAEFPPNRRNPSPEFVQANRRFIYVWGLPPLVVDDNKPANLDDPLHCIEIQKMVAKNFDVPIEQVSVATPSSAFVGFPFIDDQKFAVAVGPISKTIESPVQISKFVPTGDFGLAKEYPDALVLLENLPLGMTPTLLASSIFPAGTEVGEVYGRLSADRIVMLSPHSAVIAMESAEAADHSITSALVKERMMEIGQHRIRYAKARRELVFTGTHGGPDGTEPQRKLGLKLIVDGDMPTKAFFTSHSSTLHLRNLDPTVTKQEIASYFQPFCAVPRDVVGSTEFVTCREGLPTGRAYVGFDEFGEAEAAMEALCDGGGRLKGLGPNVVIAKRVRERIPESRVEKRPARPEEALLDSLNNWEQYVDPEDLQLLLEHNISIESLDEAFRTIRYQNPTFASLDQAMRTETVNPDRDAGGMYKELVQTYIATLKECLSTPEKPGEIYQSIHFPDEPLDTEIFEREPARQEELRKRREAP